MLKLFLPAFAPTTEVENTKDKTFVGWLVTNIQILDFLYHRASLWVSFSQHRRAWIDVVYLSTFVYI